MSTYFRIFEGKSTDSTRLNVLNQEGKLILTPTKTHDDNFLLKFAAENDGVVVSRDKFRAEMKKTDDAGTN